MEEDTAGLNQTVEVGSKHFGQVVYTVLKNERLPDEWNESDDKLQ